MKNILKKIKQAIFGKYHAIKNKRRVSKIQKANKVLKEQKTTDYERWRKNSELHDNWNERTQLLGDYISSDSRIIEFGSGNMFLKDYLNARFYTPTDIVKRFDETIVCDLNKPIELDLQNYDTAVFSGVLEYVHDIDNVFAQLEKKKVSQVLLSYCCSDIVKLSREKNGWLSDLTKPEIENIFNAHNYDIKDYKEWNNQSIFALEFKE